MPAFQRAFFLPGVRIISKLFEKIDRSTPFDVIKIQAGRDDAYPVE